MRRVKIMNWQELQHYKDRNPPWIKLHVALLSDYRFRCLPDEAKLLLILLWLLKSRQEGDIPADPTYIREMTSFKGNIDLETLEQAGFVESYDDDSRVQA